MPDSGELISTLVISLYPVTLALGVLLGIKAEEAFAKIKTSRNPNTPPGTHWEWIIFLILTLGLAGLVFTIVTLIAGFVAGVS